jgi:putative PIN family toxin of toxin-antitoxin system
MRVVVDTNVFISAALKDKSLPAAAVHRVAQRAVLLKSAATESQLFDVMARPYFAALISPLTHAWFRTLFAGAESVQIEEHFAICRDPTDDKFLELALNGKADFIVTGDLDLLVLHPFRGIAVVPPLAFLQLAGA